MTSNERAKRIEEAALALDEIHIEAVDRHDDWTLSRTRTIRLALDAALALEPAPPPAPPVEIFCRCPDYAVLADEGSQTWDGDTMHSLRGCYSVDPNLAPPPAPSEECAVEAAAEKMTPEEVAAFLVEAGIDPDASLERLYERIPDLRPIEWTKRGGVLLFDGRCRTCDATWTGVPGRDLMDSINKSHRCHGTGRATKGEGGT